MAEPIRTYMTRGVQTVGARQTMAAAHRLMRERGLRHLPVLFDGHLVGVVTERDLHLVETLRDTDPEVVLVEDAMTPDPWTVGADAPVHEVATQMADRRYGCAIVTEGRDIVGIFTTTDALRALVSVTTGPR